MGAQVTPWAGAEPVTESAIRKVLVAEGLSCYSWGNGPFDVYSAHTHDYDKVIYVLKGSITFGLPPGSKKLTLHAGDRLDLSAGTLHDAVVGAQGVTCLEAHR